MSHTHYSVYEGNIEDLSDFKTPIDYIEPEDVASNEYREASLHFLAMMTSILQFIVESDNPRLVAYSSCFALGANQVLQNRSMFDIAKELDVTLASVSGNAKRIQISLGLPVSTLMKQSEKSKNKSI